MCLRRRWRCELLDVSEQFWSDEVSNHNIYSSSLKSFFGGRLMMQLPEKVEAVVVVVMIRELSC
jgi:hypothetical protein